MSAVSIFTSKETTVENYTHTENKCVATIVSDTWETVVLLPVMQTVKAENSLTQLPWYIIYSHISHKDENPLTAYL